MRRNYHRRLSASIYHNAKNVGIIGILTYPKMKSKRKKGNRRVSLPFRGKRAENCTAHIIGEIIMGSVAWLINSRTDGKTEFFVRCRKTYVLEK